VEQEATAECTRFDVANPQRVLLYSKNGIGGTEIIVVVMDTQCELMGTLDLQLSYA